MTDVIRLLSHVPQGSPLEAALAERTEVLQLSEASFAAILTPRDPGGLSHGERAALAARIARLNGDEALAAFYDRRLSGLAGGDGLSALADPARPVAGSRHAAITKHVDLVTCTPGEAGRASIEALRSAGIGEADIVRLSQLIAFVNYQTRVIAGLRALAMEAGHG